MWASLCVCKRGARACTRVRVRARLRPLAADALEARGHRGSIGSACAVPARWCDAEVCMDAATRLPTLLADGFSRRRVRIRLCIEATDRTGPASATVHKFKHFCRAERLSDG
eukprot:6195703-Pleurochrysis_carterae.AAC.1